VRANTINKIPTQLATKSMKEIAREYPTQFVKFHSGLLALHLLNKEKPPAERNVAVTLLWGETGTGKTHRVRKAHPTGYTIRAGRGPFDNYNGEETVIFDEFDSKDWPITDMLMYLDKWECPLNCRYQNKYAAWSRIFIITNLDPKDLYTFEDERRRAAFMRRINYIIEIKSINQIVLI